MAHKVTLIPGDGIGPEVTNAAVRIIDASGVKIDWESFAAGAEAFARYGEYIPKELTQSIERTGLGLKGPVGTPIGGGFSSINVALRKQFELFANFRPIRNLPSLPTRYPSVDLAIVRENTEGLYSGIEHEVVPGANIGLKCAIFEAVHGSAPDIAGKDIANPTAVLQSGVLMLRHIGEVEAADKVHRALEKTYKEKLHLTRDVGGTAGTTAFADTVIANMQNVAAASR